MTAHTINQTFRSETESKQCVACGKAFYRDKRNSRAYWARAKFCGHACYGTEWVRRSAAKRPPMAEIFWRQVEKGSTCWIWTGIKDKDGYGVMHYAGKMLRANKVSLEIDGRPVPKGMYGCHHCDTPSCVRPDHLYVGTPADNVRDMHRRGRFNLGKKAKLTDADVRSIRASSETDEILGKRFGVSRSNISMVRSGRTWRNVA